MRMKTLKGTLSNAISILGFKANPDDIFANTPALGISVFKNFLAT